MHHRRQHRSDIAVGGLESLRHPLHQCVGRIVRDEIGRDLAAQMCRGRRMVHQNIDRLIDFGEPAALDGMAEKNLVAVIMPRRIEFERAVAHQLRL